MAKRLIATTDRVFTAVTSERGPARTLRRFASLLAPAAIGAAPRTPAASRIFQYVSQTRIHYWMGPGAVRPPRTRRGRVVGRRLPWTGGNFAVLRSLRWQIHTYGGVPRGAADVLGTGLGLAVHDFPPAPRTGLRPGVMYLVRPDGFVAAAALPVDAPEVFGRAMSC